MNEHVSRLTDNEARFFLDRYHELGYELAMRVLQSSEYHQDPERRQLVDGLLLLKKLVEQERS